MTPDNGYQRTGILPIAALILLLAGCGGVTMKNYPTADEQYREAYKEYHRKHYLKAIDGFQKVIYDFSGAPMVDSAQYFLAMSYYLQNDYYSAAAEFERLANYYPGSPFADDGQYMAGLCYYKSSPHNYGLDQDELTRAIQILKDFVTDHPESELAADARIAIQEANERLAKKRYENGRMYFRLGYYESADIYFQTVIDEHTSSEWAARSLYYQGEIDYKQKRYREAKSTFDSYLAVYPDHEYSRKAKDILAKIDKYLDETKEDK